MRRWTPRLSAVALAFAVAGVDLRPAGAVEPDEILPNSALEHRARAISSGLRCLVCQNQSIDDSSAPLARDLRLLVRERLVAGDSDKQVEDFVVARYGNFVLLKPPVGLDTVLLWATPLGLLGLAAWLVRRQTRLPAAEAADPARALTPEEEKRLSELLDKSS